MTRPRLLDLFCGAGGAAMGYHRAGFDVVGVDINPQPNYPFEFIRGDALDWLQGDGLCVLAGMGIDAIHASPPCQRYSSQTADPGHHPDLYGPTRELLLATGLPFVIENVMGAPYSHGITLCGSMFGLKVRRHRNFETNFLILQSLVCDHANQGRTVDITGHPSGDNVGRDGGKSSIPGGTHGNKWRSLEHGSESMGIDWMDKKSLPLAIPPAYTEFVGEQLLAHLKVSNA